MRRYFYFLFSGELIHAKDRTTTVEIKFWRNNFMPQRFHKISSWKIHRLYLELNIYSWKNGNMKPRIIPQNWFNPLCTIFLHRLRPISTSRKDDPIHSKESTGIYFDEELHYLSAKKQVGGLGPWELDIEGRQGFLF